MRWTVDGVEIDPKRVSLGIFAWDSGKSPGPVSIKVHLYPQGLRELGAKAFEHARELEEEEPGSLAELESSGEFCPHSAGLFEESPALLDRYFGENYWRSFAIDDLLELAGADDATADLLVTNYVGIVADSEPVTLTFGCLPIEPPKSQANSDELRTHGLLDSGSLASWRRKYLDRWQLETLLSYHVAARERAGRSVSLEWLRHPPTPPLGMGADAWLRSCLAALEQLEVPDGVQVEVEGNVEGVAVLLEVRREDGTTPVLAGARAKE